MFNHGYAEWLQARRDDALSIRAPTLSTKRLALLTTRHLLAASYWAIAVSRRLNDRVAV